MKQAWISGHGGPEMLEDPQRRSVIRKAAPELLRLPGEHNPGHGTWGMIILPFRKPNLRRAPANKATRNLLRRCKYRLRLVAQ